MAVAHKMGKLDPDSYLGFATITEHVVMDVLGDATKEKFGSSYDLISKSLGKLNVKYSILHSDGPNRHFWTFAKSKAAKLPDNYICLGMDIYRTEILKVWIIPGNSKVVNERGITISPRRQERFKKYEIDPGVYDKTFQEMDIKTKPEFYNTTKPKIKENNLILKSWNQEDQEDLNVMENQPRQMNHIMREFIEYSTPLQKIVLLSIVRVAYKHKFSFEYGLVIRYCLALSEENDFSYVSVRKVQDMIGLWSTCGVIKTKFPKIKGINAELCDIEEILLKDPMFANIKDIEW